MAVEKDNLVEVTVEDYKFKADIEALDDIEVLEDIEAMQNGSGIAVTKLLKLSMGDKEYDKMKKYFANKHGKMDIAHARLAFERIFEKFDPKG